MRTILLALFVFLHVIGSGQTVINTYHAVTAKGTDNASVVVDDVTGLKEGDRVMIIQMKDGVTMSTSNDGSYGNVTDYGNAGNYEINSICKVDAATKTLYFLYSFSKSYDFGGGKGKTATPIAKIQVVKIPVYDSYTVTNELVPLPWDSTTGKGGVLAMIVTDKLVLNGNISADGKGFKGGKYVDSNDGCSAFGSSSYVYDPTGNPQNGAYKGESIFRITISEAGGKGANANGGGGGNNHNNGGGGGANLSRGGTGGGNYSVPDNIFGCVNADPGIGGKAITVGSKDRIFLGGGGGAGQLNNALMPAIGGGAGGGIIFIQATNLITGKDANTGVTYGISANGIKGGDQQGDGAAGGGAGGSIIMNISNYAGEPLKVEAKGGNGGDVNNESIPGNCYGEGGGGSGGVIYFKGSKPAGSISVTAGLKGNKNNTTGCRSSMIAAEDGTTGIVTEGYSYTVSNTISASCPNQAPLPVKLISFKVTHKGPQATAEWVVAKPEDADHYVLQRRSGNEEWKDVQVVRGEAQATAYRKGDGPLATGVYLYRLKIVEKDRSMSFSPLQQVTINDEDLNRLMIHPNPTTSQISIAAPAAGGEWLDIYDMKSRLVYHKRITSNEPVIRQDISFLAEGVYMIQVGKLTARFVVFK